MLNKPIDLTNVLSAPLFWSKIKVRHTSSPWSFMADIKYSIEANMIGRTCIAKTKAKVVFDGVELMNLT